MKEIVIQLVILIAGFVAGFNWKKNKEMQTDAQGAGCPHCGHYCTGKTIFCTPPVKRATD